VRGTFYVEALGNSKMKPEEGREECTKPAYEKQTEER